MITEDEIKNRISMALKDSILQQGFECICKEIVELKEQNIKDCENFNKTMKEIKEQWNKEHYQLTKAKEIILKLSTCLEGHSNNNFEYELLQEAKRFLEEKDEQSVNTNESATKEELEKDGGEWN